MSDDRRVLFLGRQLLDRQIVGLHDEPIGKVDDIELEDRGPGTLPVVTGLLTGQIALGARLPGRLGRWATTSGQRLRESGTEPRRLDVSLVREIGNSIVVNVPAAEFPAPDLEVWLEHHFIARIPGAGS